MPQAKDANDVSDLIEFGKVPLDKAGERVISVYPVGFTQLKRFRKAMAELSVAIGSVDMPKADGISEQERGAAALKALSPALIPLLCGEFLDLLDDCCFPHLSKITPTVPHWIVAACATEWVKQSFVGEEKVRPYLAAVEQLLAKVTGQPVSLMPTLSRIWSDAVSTAATSLNVTGAGPTGDGASPNSESTPPPPSAP